MTKVRWQEHRLERFRVQFQERWQVRCLASWGAQAWARCAWVSRHLSGGLAFAAVAAAVGVAPAQAAPFTPTSDGQVLATVPARASDPRARELSTLRQTWRTQPKDVGAAVALARRYFEEVAAEGDPRYVGYAQATLQPWWDAPDPPAPVRVLRAKLLQFEHRFDAALADLNGVLKAEPNNVEAWSWRTAVLMVQANYAEARQSCEQLARLTTPLVAAACQAQVDATTGRADAAAQTLSAAMLKHKQATPAERLWSLTRLAELQERRGDFVAAEAAFREAIGLGVPDVYLLAAYADFLLDRGRPAEVLTLLKGRERADLLLLRVVQAAKAAKDPNAATLARTLAARFDAARLRGDTTHRKEESRFVLDVQGDTTRALVLAQENFAEQREPVDTRVLLEAALAAKDAKAAQPALAWMAASKIQSVALQPLVDKLKVLR
jgi:tetratricopeptide (TPR) repeat protein